MLSCEHCGDEHSSVLRYCPRTGKIVQPARFFPAGQVIDGKYELGRVLGAGGMGAVLEAHHVLLRKKLAIKLMLPELASDREMTARMLREAQAASSSGHRNIALVTDVGRLPDGAIYVVMEHLDGITFTQLIKREAPLDSSRAARLVDQVLAGLAAVHRHRIIHRDLKPDNLMLVDDPDDGELVKIVDFGVSKMVADDDPEKLALTTTGTVMGTPYYMAPEQARGVPDIDHRVDVYAAGAILYALLTKTRPFHGENYNALMTAIVEGNLDRPSLRNPRVSPELEAVVLKAMAKKRSERYADAQAFRADLVPFIGVAPRPSALRIDRRAERVAPASTRRPAAAAAAPTAPSAPASFEDPGSDAFKDIQLVSLDERDAPVDASVRAARSAPAAAALGDARASEVAEAATVLAPMETAQAVQQEQKHARERAGAPSAPSAVAPSGGTREVAAPGTGGPSLELDRDWRGEAPRYVSTHQPQAAHSVPIHRPGRRGLPWRAIVVVLLLAGLGALGYSQRETIRRWLGYAPSSSSETVLILVETDPRDADIYLDNVLQMTRPIELARSKRTFELRVQKAGYHSRTVEVTAERTRSVRVKLRKR